jgi:hypothetical protein
VTVDGHDVRQRHCEADRVSDDHYSYISEKFGAEIRSELRKQEEVGCH